MVGMRNQGRFGLELVRKVVHILVGILIVLLFQARILDIALFGLLILIFAALLLYNWKAEHELLTHVLSINRADERVPGLNILFYFFGCWIVLLLFDRRIAFAAIMILAFGDAVAHILSRSFGATQTYITGKMYILGTVAGIVAATLAAWIYVWFFAALLASIAAMVVEAGEFRIGSHYVDDNLTIPIVSAVVLWVISLAFPLF
jgi:dolichol kinase